MAFTAARKRCMRILLSWIREFVPVEEEPRSLATELSLLGLAVDAVTDEANETILDIDVTTNRPDCLSHHGLAREVAARYGLPLTSSLGSSQADLAAPKIKPRGRRKDGIVEI